MMSFGKCNNGVSVGRNNNSWVIRRQKTQCYWTFTLYIINYLSKFFLFKSMRKTQIFSSLFVTPFFVRWGKFNCYEKLLISRHFFESKKRESKSRWVFFRWIHENWRNFKSQNRGAKGCYSFRWRDLCLRGKKLAIVNVFTFFDSSSPARETCFLFLLMRLSVNEKRTRLLSLEPPPWTRKQKLMMGVKRSANFFVTFYHTFKFHTFPFFWKGQTPFDIWINKTLFFWILLFLP